MQTQSLASQLLKKTLSDYIDESFLFVDPITNADLSDHCFSNSDTWLFKEMSCNGNQAYLWPTKPNKHYKNVVLFLPKSKEKAIWLVEQLKSFLPTKTIIYFVGENKGGIKSSAKLFANHLDKITKVASGKHCVLLRGELNDTQAQPYHFVESNYDVKGKTVKVASLPGVFSHKELDHGTQLLLENLPANISGKVLDFACGCGVIGSFIKKYHPACEIDLCDIDSLAVESSKQTLKINELVGSVVISDGLMKISSNYQWIFSNPPFHTGIKIDYHISERFIKDCKSVLTSNGRLYIVANRFLKYAQILQDHFNKVDVVAEDNKFKVYCAYNR
ncbi:rRNA (guanine-N(2)-)-methyltransferase [Catenovulum agarivorans DS-2]|uniref:Ribosomal RNA small subunit methyltransferase C n=1 Tax=Catenovulum agarivorans DS-2 TaxID=1328313 RepID=W7QXL1_9ALTE|nr:class I SAM-dependent methyltransferase [Catenovulum agarivorans]EWH10025.1 rRNA (guanine-N(2)-)-methyltransferase [Catenovulum agarivorans DS-2]